MISFPLQFNYCITKISYIQNIDYFMLQIYLSKAGDCNTCIQTSAKTQHEQSIVLSLFDKRESTFSHFMSTRYTACSILSRVKHIRMDI